MSTFYDAMLAKVIAFADSRQQAASHLAETLATARIHGLRTNLELLVAVLRHPEFLAGNIDTGFLARHESELARPAGDPLLPAAAALAAQAARRAAANVQSTIPSGWRNVPIGLHRVSFTDGDRQTEVGYAFTRDGLEVEIDGESIEGIRLWQAEPDHVELTASGIRRRFDVHQVGATSYVDGRGPGAALTMVERLPLPSVVLAAGSLLAPLPGAVVRVLVAPQSAVRAGQPLVVLEAMKMEHTVSSPSDGIVAEVLVAVGHQVETGQVLVVVTDGGNPNGETAEESNRG